MRNKQKAYRINIYDKQNTAIVVCVTYDVGYSGKHRAGDFFQIFITSDYLNRPVIPTNRQASFCEELRALNTASEIITDENELYWIDQLMKDCYGNSSEIIIKPIDDENNS